MRTPANLPQNPISRPIPAVIIAVGTFAARSAQQAQTIYARGDARRIAASAFYQLVPNETSGIVLADLSSSPSEDGGEGSWVEKRQKALLNAAKHGQDLKTRLEQVLHEQRVHELLIDAGWDEPYDVPLNFFILADLSDPWVSGVLLPLGAVLNEILANTSLCQAHWLLGTAIFPESDPDLDIAVWSFLQAFDEFLRPISESREQLAAAMHLQYHQAPDFAVYLFDSRKEGTAMVKDPDSLSILMGNALLVLLQRDLARRFLAERDEDALFEHGSFYSSIGASALVYDPESLQAACALRIGHSFLNEKILCAPDDGQAAIRYAQQLKDKLGEIATWLERICTPLSPVVGQMRIDTGTLEMTALLTDLHLAALDFEHVHQTPWADQIKEYEVRCVQDGLAEVEAKIEDNYQQLRAEQISLLTSALDSLPLEASLYPGGVKNAASVLGIITEWLKKTGMEVESLEKRVQARQSEVAAKLSAQRQKMQTLLSEAPMLPWWIRILPPFARQWLAPLYITQRYGRQIFLAQALRDECLALLQQLCGLRIEQQALIHFQTGLPDLQKRTLDEQLELDKFEERLQQAAGAFSPDWSDFPLGAEKNGWDDLFRQLVVDITLADWAYHHWQPDLDSWIHAFLAARPLFADWRTVDPNSAAAWVIDHAEAAYRQVWTLDLESIFSLWAELILSGNTQDDGSKRKLSQKTILTCMSAAFPPVRPDFDAVGGPGNSLITFHGLIGNPNWKLCHLPPEQNGTIRWQAVYTGDSYTALFSQLRRNVPLLSLVDSFSQARRRLDAFPREQRQAYELLRPIVRAKPPGWDAVDPDSPDLVYKTFQWKFQPKGSNTEVEQSVELAVSRSRYQYYSRQPRLSGQWNCYAEVEMPEVRDLAAAFQQLHAGHRWSTFNQAFNVLKFVQSCIPYSYDKDTTGHQDWARYPIETLMEEVGDCEDVAILCAAIISRLGFHVVLLLYPKHLAFGVAGADNLKGDYVLDPNTGQRYFYGEATANGWHLGQIPSEYRDLAPEQILPVKLLLQDEDHFNNG